MFMYVSNIYHMGVLFCDTFIKITVSLRVALDSFISFIMSSAECTVASLVCCTIDLFLFFSGFNSDQFSLILHGLCNTSSLFPRALFTIIDSPHVDIQNKNQALQFGQNTTKFKCDTNSRHCMFSSYVPVT